MESCVVVAKIEHETTKVVHDASYLAELEGLATNRYTAEDSEYMQEVNGKSPAPPLVAPEGRGGGGHRYNRGGRSRGGDWRHRDNSSRDGGDRRQQRDHAGDWRQQRDHSRDGYYRGGGDDYYNNRESNRADGGGYNRHYQRGDDNGHGGYHRSNTRGGDSGQYRSSRDGSSGARGETNAEQYRHDNSDQRARFSRDQYR